MSTIITKDSPPTIQTCGFCFDWPVAPGLDRCASCLKQDLGELKALRAEVSALKAENERLTAALRMETERVSVAVEAEREACAALVLGLRPPPEPRAKTDPNQIRRDAYENAAEWIRGRSRP